MKIEYTPAVEILNSDSKWYTMGAPNHGDSPAVELSDEEIKTIYGNSQED